jgi:hypothetical protein
MRFELPVLLWLSPVIAIAIGLIARFAQQRRIRMADTWSKEVGGLARAGGRASLPLLTGAALLASVGLSGPRGGRIERLAEERGPSRIDSSTRCGKLADCSRICQVIALASLPSPGRVTC